MKRILSSAYWRGGWQSLRKSAQVVCAALLCFGLAGCDDDYADQVSATSNQLQVSVTTSLTKSTGVIRGNYLPDGATLGVSLRPSAGGTLYDNMDYTNCLYTASGTGASQTWGAETGKPILLSGTEATAYAYFPRQAEVVDITEVPISNDTETDYMYSTPVENLSLTNKSAAFEMSHVMSVVRVNVVKGNYNGPGSIESIEIKGNTAATSAKLNVMNGSLSNVTGAGSAIAKSGPWTFASIGEKDLWAVPAGASSPLQFSIGVDGVNLLATSEALELLPGKIYTYTLTINSNELLLSSVKVLDWDIKPKENLKPKPALTWETAPTGIYAVDSKWKPVSVADADYTCIGVAVVNRDLNQCFIIEKYEVKNKCYSYAQESYGGFFANAVENDPSLKESFYSYFGRGGGTSDIASLSNYNYIDGVNEKVSFSADQSEWPVVSTDYKTWTAGAWTDFNGYENSQVWKTILTNGDYDSSMKLVTMGSMMNYFNESTENLGYNDWYIPSCGQMALIIANVFTINEALEKIGGTPVRDLFYPLYLTSSESYDLTNGKYGWICGTLSKESIMWGLTLFNESNYNGMVLFGHVRLIRDILNTERNSQEDVSSNVIQHGGHEITLSGNRSGISIQKQTGVDGSVILHLTPTQSGYYLNTLTFSNEALVEQIIDHSNNAIELRIPSLSENLTINLNGCVDGASALTISGNTTGLTSSKYFASDGTLTVKLTPDELGDYAILRGAVLTGDGLIKSEKLELDGSCTIRLSVYGACNLELQGVTPFVQPAAADNGVYYVWGTDRLCKTGDSHCMGVALINHQHNQAFMIEKYEYDNNDLSYELYSSVATRFGSSYRDKFSYGGKGSLIPGITTESTIDGNITDGYLSESKTPTLSLNPDTWTAGALADFNGKANSEVLKTILDNGSETSSTMATVGHLLNAFNSSSTSVKVNLGFNDWYLPACGQLALCVINLTEINEALKAISGSILENSHWTSTQVNENCAYDIELSSNNHIRITMPKSGNSYVRFIRDL